MAALLAAAPTEPTRADVPAGLEDAAARKMMHKYAECIIKRRRALASDAIVANLDNFEIARSHASLVDGRCLSSVGGADLKMTFRGDLYRYALADALVNDAFAERGETSFADRLPLAHLAEPDPAMLATELAATRSRRKRDELRKSFDTRRAVTWLSRYGECVVRHDPVKARLWLLTPPGGPEEASRVADMRAAFNACLGEGTLKFNRTTMRGTVAINYYRLAMATPVGTKAN